MIESVKHLYASDPIVFAAGFLACLLTLAAFPYRRGTPDPRTVILIFGGCGTAGSVIKAIVWVVKVIDPTRTVDVAGAPQGTDVVLLAGCLVAGLLVTSQSLMSDMSGDEGAKRGIERFRDWCVATWLGAAPSRGQLEETKEAEKERSDAEKNRVTPVADEDQS